MRLLESAISVVSPTWALKRAHASRVLRSYQGAEANRLTNHKKPINQSANQELKGKYGADAARAWSRSFIRDHAYAWSAKDTIVSNVIGSGIKPLSVYETPAGADLADVNDLRDALWNEWCEVCDINGELSLYEMQSLAMSEIVEAGEVLVRYIRTPGKEFRGIHRPVPLALELIEADRLASDKDTFVTRASTDRGVVIDRGIEMDDKGKPIAYWIYPAHPNSPVPVSRTPERVPASDIRHLYRKDRVGQSRGITWFAPVMSWLRDLGVYVDNEIQASAVASCFGIAIETDGPAPSLSAPDGEDTQDDNGNQLQYLEPAMVTYLRKGEKISSINPGRPNSASEPWINLMLRGIAAGLGISYEAVSKDFSKTSYSSSRTSKLEDRPRFKRWQQMILNDLCQPVWDEFCNAAALVKAEGFPTSSELLDARRKFAPVEWQTPEWEWVDPASEQDAAEKAVHSLMSTRQAEIGSRGKSWRLVMYQLKKENDLRQRLGLLTPDEQQLQVSAQQSGGTAEGTDNVAALALNGAQVTSLVDVITQIGTGALPKDTAKAVLQAAFPDFLPEIIDSIVDPIEPGSVSADGTPTATVEASTPEMGSGEMMGLSTQQWNRNRKAIGKILDELATGATSAAAARVFLSSVGMSPANVDILIADASDGTVETSTEEVADVQP